MRLADAAAIPEVWITAHDALVSQGGLTSGGVALVHAGASGVGTAAIQIAKAVNARVVVTASSAMEYAFEGDQLTDDHSPRPSMFTSALVEGLATGDADRDEEPDEEERDERGERETRSERVRDEHARSLVR